MAVLTVPTRDFGYKYDIEIQDWQHQLKAYRVFEDGKQPLDGGLGLGFNLITPFDPSGDWLASIPSAYVEATENFEEYQYQILYLVANSTKAAQLLEKRPLLLVLLCHKYHVDSESALACCQLGQREILKAIGLSSRKSVLKFLDKLSLDYQQGDELRLILRLLKPETNRYLLFQQYYKVNYRMLRLDEVYPFLSGSRLGLALLGKTNEGKHKTLVILRETFLLAQKLEIAGAVEQIRQQKSFAGLNKLHDEWQELAKQRLSNFSVEDFKQQAREVGVG